ALCGIVRQRPRFVAYLIKRGHTTFWHMRYRDLDTGVWREKSTGLRIADPVETRKAQRAADQASIEEHRVGAPGTSHAFLAWVPIYLNRRCGRRYHSAWYAIKTFLAQRNIVYPRQVRYAHADDYMVWRKRNRVFGHSVGHNAALLELKFLSQLMSEAVRRELVDSNPLLKLGIEREPAREKPELTDEHIAKLRAAYKRQPSWMGIAAEISLYTGCRFSECEIPTSSIDLQSKTLRIRDAKRKETDSKKYFTVPIHPKLLQLLTNLKRRNVDGVTCSVSGDKNGRINKVIKKTLNDTFSFHCYRVTFVTRCHRGGLTESEAMRLVNHSSSLVHRIYSRLNVDDVRKAQKKVPLP